MDKTFSKYREINRIPMRFFPIMTVAFLTINILSLALPLTMKKIYSSIVGSQSITQLRLMILMCLIALLMESILRKFKDSSSRWIASKYEYQLSNFLVSKILNTFKDDTASNYNSDLEKLNSVSRISVFYATRIYQLFIDLPFVVLFLYFIYLFGGMIVLVPISLSLLYIVIVLSVSKPYFKHLEDQVRANDKMTSLLTETLDKIHLVKAAGIEDMQMVKFRRVIRDITESGFMCNRYQGVPDILSSNFSQLNLFSTLIVGGFLLSKGEISFGEITACAMLGSRAINPVKRMMKLYLKRLEMKLLRERIDQIALKENKYAEEVPDFPDDIKGTIELLDMEYTNVQTQSNESITSYIPAGSMVFVNPSEWLSYRNIFNKLIGKSEVEHGKILIDNLDITKWNMKSLKGKIEHLTERVGIYKGSVMENITYFDRSTVDNAYEAASLTGLDDLVGVMAEGFETPLDNHSKNLLSSGFLQRLNLSRALITRPRILVIDCIDEGMDSATLESYIWLLEKLRGNMTIIIATRNERIKAMATMKWLEEATFRTDVNVGTTV